MEWGEELERQFAEWKNSSKGKKRLTEEPDAAPAKRAKASAMESKGGEEIDDSDMKNHFEKGTLGKVTFR